MIVDIKQDDHQPMNATRTRAARSRPSYPTRHLPIKILPCQPANKALVLVLLLDGIHAITKLAKRVNNETLTKKETEPV